MKKIIYTLVMAAGSLYAAEFKFETLNDKSVQLSEGGKPVFVYNNGMMLKEGVPADRVRSSYLHPIYGLQGEVLTDDFPRDHYHHRGLFWAWPHITVDGKEYDVWTLKGAGQQFERWITREASAEQAILAVENSWVITGGRKIMKEEVKITVHPTRSDSRAIDLDFVWTPLTKLTLAGAEGKSYGGLTMRYAPRTNTVITTPVGSQEIDLSITRLPWADYDAQFPDGKERSGAAIFVAPNHPDFPPTWLTRYYGALCLGWPGVTPETFEAGQAIRCQYRIWLHSGKVTQARLQEAYDQYAAPFKTPVKCNEFFAFDNGVGRGKLDPAEQARVLKDLGYQGISYNETRDVTNRVAAMREQGLKLYALYVHGFMNQPVRYEPGLVDALKHLRNTDTILWLTIREWPGQHDAEAVKLAREVADLAAKSGIRVALYPHKGFYVATAEDALRIAKAANKPNLGVSINLAHEILAGNAKRLESIVEECAPYLYLVSINGADVSDDTAKAIKVLGEGEFDVLGFLRTLDKNGYFGPIGLQCYNVPGETRANLQKSLAAWHSHCQERDRSPRSR